VALTDRRERIVIPTEARFPPPSRVRLKYDRVGDILTLSTVPVEPAISVDMCGEGWARLAPATGRLVGLEIEEFQHSFLRRHTDLARLWHRAQSHPRILGIPRKERREFLDRLLSHFQRQLTVRDA
jgi:hypothetical protein